MEKKYNSELEQQIYNAQAHIKELENLRQEQSGKTLQEIKQKHIPQEDIHQEDIHQEDIHQEDIPPPLQKPPQEIIKDPSSASIPDDDININALDSFLNDFDAPAPKLSSDTIINKETNAPEDVIPGGDDDTAPEDEIISESAIKEKWRYWLKLRFEYQSKGLAAVAGDARLENEFKISATEFEILVNAYARGTGNLINKVPAWFEILVIESIVTGRQIRLALKIKRNGIPPQLQTAPQEDIPQEDIPQDNIPQGLSITREHHNGRAQDNNSAAKMPKKIKNRSTSSKQVWRLDDDGYFIYNRNGQYLKQERREEKPDTSINFVSKLIAANNG